MVVCKVEAHEVVNNHHPWPCQAIWLTQLAWHGNVPTRSSHRTWQVFSMTCTTGVEGCSRLITNMGTDARLAAVSSTNELRSTRHPDIRHPDVNGISDQVWQIRYGRYDDGTGMMAK